MKKQIVIVDDFENTRWIIQQSLSKENYNILLASNGKEALEYFDGREIDLLITDYNMPELNGIELIKKVKEDKQYEFLPIILLTTERNAEKLKAAENVKVTTIVNKPFEVNSFRKIVNKCVNQYVR